MKKLIVIYIFLFIGLLAAVCHAQLPPKPQVDNAFILQTSGTLYNQLVASEQYAARLERQVYDLTAEVKMLKEKYEKTDPSAAAPSK